MGGREGVGAEHAEPEGQSERRRLPKCLALCLRARRPPCVCDTKRVRAIAAAMCALPCGAAPVQRARPNECLLGVCARCVPEPPCLELFFGFDSVFSTSEPTHLFFSPSSVCCGLVGQLLGRRACGRVRATARQQMPVINVVYFACALV